MIRLRSNGLDFKLGVFYSFNKLKFVIEFGLFDLGPMTTKLSAGNLI